MNFLPSLTGTTTSLRRHWKSLVMGAAVFGYAFFLVGVTYTQGVTLYRQQMLSGDWLKEQQSIVSQMKLRADKGDQDAKDRYANANAELSRMLRETAGLSVSKFQPLSSPTEALLYTLKILLSVTVVFAACVYFFLVCAEDIDAFEAVKRLRTATPRLVSISGLMFVASCTWLPLALLLQIKLGIAPDISEPIPLALLTLCFGLVICMLPRVLAAPVLVMAGEAKGMRALLLSMEDSIGHWWALARSFFGAAIVACVVRALVIVPLGMLLKDAPPLVMACIDAIVSFFLLGVLLFHVMQAVLFLYDDVVAIDEPIVVPEPHVVPGVQPPTPVLA